MWCNNTKKTIPITIGETKLPNKIPNLNQILFNGVKIFEFNKS